MKQQAYTSVAEKSFFWQSITYQVSIESYWETVSLRIVLFGFNFENRFSSQMEKCQSYYHKKRRISLFE